MKESTLRQLQDKALQVKNLYAQLNRLQGHKQWQVDDYMSGFVGDVGDLSKLIMAKQGYRGTQDVNDALSHELSDCLWSVLVLAQELDIDLDTIFNKSMTELAAKIKAKKEAVS